MADSNETRGRHSSLVSRAMRNPPGSSPTTRSFAHRHTLAPHSPPLFAQNKHPNPNIRKAHSQSVALAADEPSLHPPARPPSFIISPNNWRSAGAGLVTDPFPHRALLGLGLGFSPTFGLWQRIRLRGIAGIGGLAGIGTAIGLAMVAGV